ncbi:MAG: YggS family pyridoxal phosphate-dependent enzyme [Spirochaetes bacterium]|nr:YggS family pyridoxal phosphate-dependent enzyme [Spirochaetota bacterium]
MGIFENYREICEDVEHISVSAGRNPGSVKIVAISKTFPVMAVQDAIDNGILLFGENKVQEAKQKIALLKGEFAMHLVGHLQSNKAKDAVKIFDLIHSIDKFSTAFKTDEEAKKISKIQKILVQVNTSGEETKSGIAPEETIKICRDILSLKNLEILGLMTIGPLTEDADSIRTSFKMLKNLLKETNAELGLDMKELSMGMSSDYRIAVEEGATMLRIGSAIFGQRTYGE